MSPPLSRSLASGLGFAASGGRPWQRPRRRPGKGTARPRSESTAAEGGEEAEGGEAAAAAAPEGPGTGVPPPGTNDVARSVDQKTVVSNQRLKTVAKMERRVLNVGTGVFSPVFCLGLGFKTNPGFVWVAIERRSSVSTRVKNSRNHHPSHPLGEPKPGWLQNPGVVGFQSRFGSFRGVRDR